MRGAAVTAEEHGITLLSARLREGSEAALLSRTGNFRP